jgi:hypothetical protein
MKPSRIPQILDVAWKAREQGKKWNPMFVGEAGVGKSEITQGWARDKNEEFKDDGGFGILDIRLAYYEGPDLVGLPEVFEINGVKRTINAIPDIFPTEGRGIIMLEEPNRGNSMIQNCLMQMLTDRMVGPHFKLPEGWIIVGLMNPEGGRYDTNSMDAALRDRFVFFDVEYHHQSFVEYVESNDWHDNVKNYIMSNDWVYMTPDRIAEGGKYISSRTWKRMSDAEQTEITDLLLHREICTSILGKFYGEQYYQFCYDDAPIMAKDLLADMEGSLEKLKKLSSTGDTYAGDRLHATVESIVSSYGGWYEGRTQKKRGGGEEDYPHKEGTMTEEQMVAVAMVIPADLAVGMIRDCGRKTNKTRQDQFLAGFVKRHPECTEMIRSHLQVLRSTK